MKGCAEVSTLVSERLMGVGYGALISQFALKLCFEELNLIKVIYKVRKDNFWVPNRVYEQLIREVPIEKGIVQSYYYGEITKI